MTTVLCTLFNSLYLDKGLVLYDSLCECAKDFKLYVLCMDDKCYEVLTDLNQDYLIPIKLEDFEGDELLGVKPMRSFGEYFWTCSSWLISYVLETFNPENCTYIDADMYFYNDPMEIIEEMYSRDASVLIVGHRFFPFLAEEKAYVVGKYCVEFNTFKNNDKARSLLEVWKRQVIEHCSIDGDGVYWGDQKYLDNWIEDYDFVIETSHLGAGVAPWNISQYKMVMDGDVINLRYQNRKTIPLVFYHFENIQYLSPNKVDTGIECFWGIDRGLIIKLYTEYLSKINQKKIMLKRTYGIDILIKSHPGVVANKKQEVGSSVAKRILLEIKDIRHLYQNMKRIIVCSLPRHMYNDYKIINF